MPAGCDLSHVLGTALLSTVDDQLMSLLDSDQAAVRWVDDYKFGVDNPDYADHVLDELARGSLADLQLALHPDKTKVVPSRRYVSLRMSGTGRIDDGDEEVEPIAAAELRRRLSAMPPMQPLGKEDSRSLLEGAEGDEAAMVLAEHAPQLLAGNYRKLPVRLRQLAGEPLPEEITNLLLYSLAHGIEPSSPTDGEAAYVLSYLVHEPGAEIGASGRHHLKAIATNSRRTERTRATAAWTLASETDDFERTLLEQVGGMSPLAARGILAAAHRAGAKPRTEHWAAGAIAA